MDQRDYPDQISQIIWVCFCQTELAGQLGKPRCVSTRRWHDCLFSQSNCVARLILDRQESPNYDHLWAQPRSSFDWAERLFHAGLGLGYWRNVRSHVANIRLHDKHLELWNNEKVPGLATLQISEKQRRSCSAKRRHYPVDGRIEVRADPKQLNRLHRFILQSDAKVLQEMLLWRVREQSKEKVPSNSDILALERNQYTEDCQATALLQCCPSVVVRKDPAPEFQVSVQLLADWSRQP